MREILLIAGLLVLVNGCGDESSKGKANADGGSNRAAASSQPAVAEEPATKPAASLRGTVAEEKPTLRTAIVGTWEESKFGGGRGDQMTFSKDGRYEAFAVSTKYAGTYRVVDEHTIELNAASVLSDMRLVKTTLKVDWRDDLLTVTSETPRRTYVKK